jgi:phage gp29-like protein
MADWGQYIEIFGMPVRIIKYDAYDEKTKIEVGEILESSGGALAIMVPKQAEFEMLDGKTSNADGKLQETFRQALNDEMSVIILGNTESTTSSKSSGYAQSQTHSAQQLINTKSDLEEVQNFLNSPAFITVCKSYALPVVEGGKFEFEKEIDLDALSTKKDIDLAVSAKVPIADDYWYETYGIPKPDNYAELRKKMDDQKMMELQPQGPPNNKPPKNKKPGKGMPALSDTNAWNKLRQTLADFFDPALR